MGLLDAVSQAVSEALGEACEFRSSGGVGGGCIHRAMVVESGHRENKLRYFVKANDASAAAMFEAERDGLNALAAPGAVRVPQVITTGTAGTEAFLVLEFLDLSGRPDPAAMGRALAALHRSTAAHFGWRRDNYIGATVQINGEDTDWPRFYAERRLRPQLEIARQRGCPAALYDEGMKLANNVGKFFTAYRPGPSLLHGDLWGGNAAYLRNGTPVIFDPAAYWGDREADLAMTELFGGFGAEFYAAYREAWPLDPGYGIRKNLYNLYHILNHYNLFGGGYADQGQRMARQLLAAAGT